MLAARLRLVLVFVACLAWAQCLAKDAAHLDNVRVQVSRLDLRAGDAYNVSCSFEQLKSLQALCAGDGIDSIYMQTRRNANLSVRILNATTVYHEQVAAQPKHVGAYSYECLCHGKTLGSARFMVGVRLQVQDFGCRFHGDLAEAPLNCSFSRPPFSRQVDMTTSYWLRHRHKEIECRADGANVELMHCSIGHTDFDRFAEYYDLTLSMRDRLPLQPLQQQHFRLSRTQCIQLLPAGTNATVAQLNSTALCLAWRDSDGSNHIGYHIDWKMQLLPTELSGWRWQQPHSQQRNSIWQQTCLTHLPYPYYNYTLLLWRRYNDSDAHWSEPFEYSFRTMAALPARPPAVWPTGYHRNPQQPDELRVYWQQLDELERNGPLFDYHVHVLRASDDQHVKQAEIAIDSNMAIIRNLEPSKESYIVVIHSRNAIGLSTSNSQVRIPELVQPGKRIPRNVNRSKMLGSLSWEPPEQSGDLLGYTVYWCSTNVTDRSHCNETLAIESTELLLPNSCYYENAKLRLDSYEWGVSGNYGPHSTGSGGIYWLEWHYGTLLLSPNPLTEVDWMHNLQGIVALVVLGVFIHMIVRKFRTMSDIDVVLPVGVDSCPPQQQQPERDQDQMQLREQLLPPSKRPEQLPASGMTETSIVADCALLVELPAVLHGNFKPLDMLLTQTGYVPIQLKARTEALTAAELNSVPLKRPASPSVDFASTYIRMQPRQAPPDTSYVAPSRAFR
ncbi:cytokine receptor isoform X1 [Drosophila virilis]|uniref:Fibronectin type-III domain-containing protein n=1 Tax=Drosophila virilis TaxID=7244 RepID=B4MAQ7_DROVI|nr:cytokine receptor isoform X1 [Drosophila virilis]EDW66316.1 uncharacterized protein Dvir_GJ15620 [Drosophila virilis]